MALALDATSLGDRFTVLSIGVVYRGEAIPVAWKVLHANVPHPWKPEWIALLRVFAGLVPPGWTVIMMTDRGLYARWLYQEIVALGWHPVMRITKQSKFRKAGSKKAVPVTALVPRVGCRWQGRGVAFPKKPERRLECTLMACWEEGYDEPWFLVTDLDPDQAEGLWYGMRSWIEGGFKLLKSGGWQWQATRMTDPDRVQRLWLVLAVATRYVLAVGGEADAAEFADAAVPEPAARPVPPATARRPARGAFLWSRAAPQCGGAGDSRPSAAAAANRDETAPGQRVPTRLGGVAEHNDRRSCVAEALLETRSLVGNTVRDQAAAPATSDSSPEKPLPLSGGFPPRRTAGR